MKNINDSILTDEELDKVVGGNGITYEYKLITDDPKGDYYQCNIYENGNFSGTTNIGTNEWDEWVNKVTSNGDTIIKMK